MAKYANGQWFCHCGYPAKWLKSTQPHSSGWEFARCRLNDGVGCRFWMWAKDEPFERAVYQAKTQGQTNDADIHEPHMPPAESTNRTCIPEPNTLRVDRSCPHHGCGKKRLFSRNRCTCRPQ
ncbi:hypothetical protein VCV18_010715 [Metarhizium anisopliae]